MCGGTMKMDIIMNWMMISTLKPTTNATQLRLRSINRRRKYIIYVISLFLALFYHS